VRVCVCVREQAEQRAMEFSLASYAISPADAEDFRLSRYATHTLQHQAGAAGRAEEEEEEEEDQMALFVDDDGSDRYADSVV
jgi:hypothetical protein